MSGQSWRQIVEEIGGPEPLPVVYNFSHGRTDSGVFKERKLHGAYLEDPIEFVDRPGDGQKWVDRGDQQWVDRW